MPTAARGRDLTCRRTASTISSSAARWRRALDARIEMVVRRIAESPSAPLTAEACAAAVHLSFSRFLHLFKQEVGCRSAASAPGSGPQHAALCHAGLQPAEVALDIGYPDSTHFSHSIRQIYGLKPSDIFAGSRRLELIGTVAAAPGRPS